VSHLRSASPRQAVEAAGYGIRVTIAGAFLLCPLFVMSAKSIWGPLYGASPFKYFIYVLTYTIVPLAGAGAYALHRQCSLRCGAASLLEIALTAPGLAAAALYLSASGAWIEWSRIEFVAVVASAAALAGAAASFLLPRRWAETSEKMCKPAATAVAFISPMVYAGVILWGQADWLIEEAGTARTFDWGLAAGAVSVAAVYAGPSLLVARRSVTRTIGKLCLAILAVGTAAALLIIASQVGYSCGAPLWAQSYNELVDPAVAVLAGGIPMVDAFSQYGFGYLAYAAAFKFIFPPSYYAVDAVTGLFNAAAPMVAIIVCMKVERNRFVAQVVLIVVSLSLPWIWHAVPANAAPRFGPPLLLLLALAWLRPGRMISLATVSAMLVCAFWSFEAIVWSVVTYAGFLCAVCLERRGGLSKALVSLALVLSSIVIANLAFALWVHAESGSWPRYDTYAASVYHNVSLFWVATPELASPLWLIVVGACLAALAYALLLVLWRDQSDPRTRWMAVSVVLPGAVMCVIEQSYWVNRTFQGTQWQVILPVAISLTVLLDRLLMRGSRRIIWPRWVEVPVQAVLMLSILLLSALASSLVADYGGRSRDYVHVMTGRPVAPCIGDRANDAMILVNKYNPGRSDALYFMPGADDLSIALYSGIQQRLGYVVADIGLPWAPLMDEAWRRLSYVRPGDVLVTVSRFHRPPVPTDDLLETGSLFVEALIARFQACEIERTPRDVIAVRLMPKHEDACRGIGKPFAYEVHGEPRKPMLP